MGGAGRKSREGCVETERMREGWREGGTLRCCSLRLGLRKDMFMVWGLGLFFFLIQHSNTVPSAKDTSAPGQSFAMVRWFMWWSPTSFPKSLIFFLGTSHQIWSSWAELNNSFRQRKLHTALPTRCVEECLSVMMERLKTIANSNCTCSSTPQRFLDTLAQFHSTALWITSGKHTGQRNNCGVPLLGSHTY